MYKISYVILESSIKRTVQLPQGDTRSFGQSQPKRVTNGHNKEAEKKNNKFGLIVNDAGLEGRSEEPENTLETQEFLEEEKAFRNAASLYPSTDYARGWVNFEELTKIGTLIKKQDLAMDDEKQIIHIAKKIDGKEIMGFLELSMSSASQKKCSLIGQKSTFGSRFFTNPF
ncbi:hypothetical protein [Elizabethkingia anophelis]|uniref:hypothetical protein n=1 Tax=Elizabethkingia anophelis TaxID=1117645 RepID=UPI001368CF3F|nr:hypothetical protein [Elizabethkingia anophelis]MYY43936.1 hypothetical protein [Elizabethkingia anophelis]